jgi:hypothetical protein
LKPDGGTLRAGIDLGMDVAVNTTIRFYGCNAPRHARRSCPGTAAVICGKTSIDHARLHHRHAAAHCSGCDHCSDHGFKFCV